MNYDVNQFFIKEECDYIIDYCMKYGEPFSYSYREKNTWDCRRVYDEEFKKYILEKIVKVKSFDGFKIRNINVSLTRYYDGRYLDLHLDSTSNYTTVISLTDQYIDGRFTLSDTRCNINESEIKLHLNIGEGVTFEGNKTYHGVLPVTNGLRCALNIWMNDSDFVYYKLDTKKKLL